MTSQIDRARRFHSLHVRRDPVILYNIWDAGSAVAAARAGAKAIATGSWSVAAAQGHADGERIPLDDALATAARIVASVELPVTIDFEGGYAVAPEGLRANVRRLLSLGVVGLNFEDQIVGGAGLHDIDVQVARLRAVREAADALGVPAFINARTDVFLKASPDADPAGLLGEALKREAAYAAAGADCFFAPGLTDRTVIGQLCAAATLPVNVMMKGEPQDARDLAALGVARISFGPGPYRSLYGALEREAARFF